MANLKVDNFKGASYAFVSAISVSLVFILSKAIQQSMQVSNFLFWWFGFASVWGLIIVIKSKMFKSYFEITKKNKGFLIYFAISEALGTFLFFYLIKNLNPSIVSFLVGTYPILVVVWGYLILDEKLNFTEGFGAIVAIAGLIIINYTTPEISFKYLMLVLVMIFIFSFNNVMVRKKSDRIPSFLVTVSRIFFLFLCYTIFIMVSGSFKIPSLSENLKITFGSLFGPILGMFAMFYALKYTKAITVSIIKSLQPFFVAIGSSIFLSMPLTPKQLIGGIIMVVGINIILIGKKYNFITILRFR